MNRFETIGDPLGESARRAGGIRSFAGASVTDRVWHSLLALSAGEAELRDPGWSAEETAAYALYEPLAAAKGSFVFAQIGQSIDGRVATVEGDAADISGTDGLKHLHRCRALADCVIVGANTAVKDDPRLTVRLVTGPDPVRAVIDPRGRLAEDAAMLAGKGCACLVIRAAGCRRRLPAGAIELPADADGGLDPAAILAALHERGFRRILVEGGAITIGNFLDAGLLDRLHVAIAPLIVGSGPAGLAAAPIARLAEARRPSTRVYGLGTDIVVDCALK